jgi:23S rRNA pseudouridine1911/1915/1917 synthase
LCSTSERHRAINQPGRRQGGPAFFIVGGELRVVIVKRSFIVGRPQTGRPLLEVLRSELHLGRDDALRCVQKRHVRLDGRPCNQAGRQVRAGQRIEVELPERAATDVPGRPKRAAPVRKPVVPAIAHEIVVHHIDAQVIVVAKPAGLTTVRHADEVAEAGRRARRFLPPTLVDLLPAVLAKRGIKGGSRIRAVHRLDKETSGLLVLARTAEAESNLGQQFRRHSVGRHYVALVRGRAHDQRIESHLVPDRGDHRRGSSGTAEGQLAVTNVHVLETLGDYTLVECRLETGRTHQVRLHLGESGTPLCGERVYDRPVHGAPRPDDSGARRPLLHAASLEFDHPATGERLKIVSPLPDDMKAHLSRLRKARGRH